MCIRDRQKAFEQAQALIERAQADATQIIASAQNDADNVRVSALRYTDELLGKVQIIAQTALREQEIHQASVITSLKDVLALSLIHISIGGVNYTVGGLATLMSGPAMAVAIGKALKCPALVLFSLVTAGFASNALGGAGGPLAVLFVAIITAEIGKMVAGSTKVDILVTPLVTVGVGVFLSWLIAPALGKAASSIGGVIMRCV